MGKFEGLIRCKVSGDVDAGCLVDGCMQDAELMLSHSIVGVGHTKITEGQGVGLI